MDEDRGTKRGYGLALAVQVGTSLVRAHRLLRRAVAIGMTATGVATAQAAREPPGETRRGQSSPGASVEPTSREAASWIAERPQSLPYRLALARALVREGRPRTSLAHFDYVLARDASPPVLGEAAAAHAAAGDHDRALDLYRRAVEGAPAHTALRQAYARALLNRARAHFAAHDDSAAVRDVQASIAQEQTPEAYTVLGDVYLARERFRQARGAYERAVALRPSDANVAARLTELARAEQPAFGYTPRIDDEVGVVTGVETLTDNAGFAYVWGEARAAFRVRPGTVLGVGVERRVVRERPLAGVAPDADAEAGAVTGVGATIVIAHELGNEDLAARVAARAGAASHSASGVVPLFTMTASATHRGGWSVALETDGGPAYAELLALGMTGVTSALAVDAPEEALLSVRSFAVAVVIPFGAADLSARVGHLRVSDGNVRSTFEASARLPLRPGLSLFYCGGTTAFRARSTLYWDPRWDVAHALGFEVGRRSDEGLAFAIRALPGIGRTTDGLTRGHPEGAAGTERFVAQFAADADVSVQRQRWDAAVGAGVSTGRAGGYRQLEAGFRVRYLP